MCVCISVYVCVSACVLSACVSVSKRVYTCVQVCIICAHLCVCVCLCVTVSAQVCVCVLVCVWGAGRPTRPQQLAPELVTLTAFLLRATGSRAPAGPRVGGAWGWRPEPVSRGRPLEADAGATGRGPQPAGPGRQAPLLHTEWTDFSFPAAAGGNVYF